MLFIRTILSAGLLALVGASGAASEDSAVRFLSPTDGDIVAGFTEFKFEVKSSEPAVERVDVYVKGVLVGTATAPTWSFSWTAAEKLRAEKIGAVAYDGDGIAAKAVITTSDISLDAEIDVTLVELFPVVTNRQGRYVSGLDREEFLVFDEGQEMPIQTFSEDVTSLSVAVLIDVSNSMMDKLGSVQEASCQFIDQLRDSDRIAIYAFNHALSRRTDLTEDASSAKRLIRSMTADGGTALFDAVTRVSSEMAGIRGRKALVVFSDGQDERSLTTLDRTGEQALKSEVIIYAVGAGDTDEDLEARTDLRRLAERTGGQAHFITKMRSLSRVFDDILADLRAQYSLAYEPPSAEPGFRRVVVQVRGGGNVRARKGYFNRVQD